MNIHTIHADYSEQSTHAKAGLRQLLARWFKAVPPGHCASDSETDSAPAVWPELPEVAGRPYVIGPGTLLVMTYMRKRMR